MRVQILGSAQDGGVPHLGCSCDHCSVARGDRGRQRSPASLKVYDEEKGVNYLFDVSPDIRFQLGDDFIDGVFISHAHIGHITGLLYLGIEAFNADMVPVHCSNTVNDFLQETPPYRMLLDRGNITTKPFASGTAVDVMGVDVTPVPIQNKGYVETDTHAFFIRADDTDLFYMTDADALTPEIVKNVTDADIAIIDGTFWAPEEIDRYETVPHPTITESLETLDGVDTEIYFTHINHTNPVLDQGSAERQRVEDAGHHIAEDGMEMQL